MMVCPVGVIKMHAKKTTLLNHLRQATSPSLSCWWLKRRGSYIELEKYLNEKYQRERAKLMSFTIPRIDCISVRNK